MSAWAICSSRRVPLLALVLLGAPTAAWGQLTLPEALEAAFPKPAQVERRTAFLSPEDLAAIGQEAGPDVPVTQRVITYYVATRGGQAAGVAYFDSHRVRTFNEVLMIVVEPDDRIRNIEVLRFAEPPEYHANERWLRQFEGVALAPELSLKGSIANLTGATLTSNATVRAARRVLAIHHRIHSFDQGGR